MGAYEKFVFWAILLSRGRSDLHVQHTRFVNFDDFEWPQKYKRQRSDKC